MTSLASSTAALIFALVASASCASSGPHAARTTHTPDPSVPKCAGDGSIGCITTPVCQYDERHQCEACICSPVMQTTEQVQAAPFSSP
jgi:hypothetical protein